MLYTFIWLYSSVRFNTCTHFLSPKEDFFPCHRTQSGSDHHKRVSPECTRNGSAKSASIKWHAVQEQSAIKRLLWKTERAATTTIAQAAHKSTEHTNKRRIKRSEKAKPLIAFSGGRQFRHFGKALTKSLRPLECDLYPPSGATVGFYDCHRSGMFGFVGIERLHRNDAIILAFAFGWCVNNEIGGKTSAKTMPTEKLSFWGVRKKNGEKQVDGQKQKCRPERERARAISIESCVAFKTQIKMSLNNR